MNFFPRIVKVENKLLTPKLFNIGDVSILSKHVYRQYDLRDWSEIIFGGSNQPRQIFVRQFCEFKYDSLGAFV